MTAREWANSLFVQSKRCVVPIPPHPEEFLATTLKRNFDRLGKVFLEVFGESTEIGTFWETFMEVNRLKKDITALGLFEELEKYRTLYRGEYLSTLYDLNYLVTRTKISLGRRSPNVSFINNDRDRVRVDIVVLPTEKLGIFSNSLVAVEGNSFGGVTKELLLSKGTCIITSRLY